VLILKKCILNEEYKMGAMVFFFDHPDTTSNDFNENYVRLFYTDKDEQPFLRCHVSKIVELPIEATTNKTWGHEYLDSDWFEKLHDQWVMN
jgi:hypothetical protein